MVITGAQCAPAVTIDSVTSNLYLIWSDEAANDFDIRYARLTDLPSGSINGTLVSDDSSHRAQVCPAIAVSTVDGVRKVYTCWQDQRNLSNNNDNDIYFSEMPIGDSRFGTNVFVPDDGGAASQTCPAICADGNGLPYMIWVDDRNGVNAIYGATSTAIHNQPLERDELVAADGGQIGKATSQIQSVNDVSLAVPANAFWSDVTVSISKIDFPRLSAKLQSLAFYEFGPSSKMEFIRPVTITIPYAIPAGQKVSATVYWLNPNTGELSQSGISNIKDIPVSSTLRAVQFNTTHFSTYVVGATNPQIAAMGSVTGY